jgi:hypothetical protein
MSKKIDFQDVAIIEQEVIKNHWALAMNYQRSL